MTHLCPVFILWHRSDVPHSITLNSDNNGDESVGTVSLLEDRSVDGFSFADTVQIEATVARQQYNLRNNIRQNVAYTTSQSPTIKPRRSKRTKRPASPDDNYEGDGSKSGGKKRRGA